MMKTIEQYLGTYGISVDPGLENMFRKYAILPDDMLDAKTEFLCDCLWHALGRLEEIRENLATTNMMLSSSELRYEEWNRVAKACAECFANRVRAVWNTYGRGNFAPGKYIDNIVVPFVRDVITQIAVPCPYPWDAVAACQVEPGMADALRNAAVFDEMSDNVRQHQYADIVATCRGLLMNPTRTDKAWCRNEGVADAYLALAASVLQVETTTYRDECRKYAEKEATTDGSN